MRRFKNGRILGLILTAAMLITSVPADVLAVEDLTLSEDVILESVNTGENAETVAPAPENALQTTEDSVPGEVEDNVSQADEILNDGDIAEEVTADEVAADDVVDENTSADVTAEDDAVSDDIIQDGTALEEDADTLSDNEVTRDLNGTPKERLEGYLREGAINIEAVAGSFKEGKNYGLGTDVKSEIYIYDVGEESYRAVYIWSDTTTGASLDGKHFTYTYLPSERDTLTDIILDDTITGISTDRMFGDLWKVSHVRLSSKLKSFSNGLFESCTSLESITIPRSLETAEGNTFWKCEALKTITFENGIEKIPDKFAKNGDSSSVNTDVDKCAIATVNIPASVKDIGDEAFAHLRHLKTVNFMDPSRTTLAHIGSKAFNDTYLSSISLPKFGGKWYDPYTKKNYTPVIEGLAFDDVRNPAFKTLIIPEGVVTIPAIWQYSNLEYIYLPSTLKRTDLSATLLSGAYESFIHPMPTGIKQIYYNGSETQFFKTALNNYKWRNKWKESYSAVYSKLKFNAPAPRQVTGITVPSDKTVIKKYLDDFSEGATESIDLAITPESHLEAEYRVESSDTTVVEATLGAETDSRLPLTLKYHQKSGEANITVYGGLANTTLKVIIKEKDRAVEPVFIINGVAVTGTEAVVKKGDWVVAESATRDCIVKYTVGGMTAEFPDGLTVGSDIFKDKGKDEEINIEAQAFKDPDLISSKISKIKLINKLDMGDVTDTDMLGRSIIPDGLWIPNASYPETPDYTGSAITVPGLRVFYYNRLLRNGKDYTVKYFDNVDSSEVSGKNATFTVTGKAPYSGTAYGSFYIKKKDFYSYSDYSCTPVTLNYTGEGQTADIGLVYAGRKLTLGKDYSVKYRFSGTTGPIYEKVSNPGQYDVLVTCEGNYDGSFYIYDIVYVVDPAEYVNMNAVTVSKIKDQQLVKKNTPVEPKFTVTYNKQVIPADVGAYTVEYNNNKSAGTASVTLTGTKTEVTVGGKAVKFMGTKTFTFKIKPINMSSVTVTLSAPEFTYRGAAIIPDPEVKLGDYTLQPVYDYTISYKSNTKAGNAYAILNGKGSFTGKKKVKFKINKAELKDENVTLDTNYKYTVGGFKHAVTVKLGGVTLSGKDYKVTYGKNNSLTDPGTVTVTGKGSCMGTVSKTFTITPGDLSNCRTTFSDKMVSNKAKKYAQNLTIKDTNGKKLKAGRDYSKTFEYTYAEDTLVEQKTGKKSSIKVLKKAGEAVGNSDIIPAGTTIIIRINGTGNYAGSFLEGRFRFGTKKVSSLKFSIPNQKYTGSRILPGKDLISVKNMTKDDASKCYEIVSYGTNIKTGKGSVTVRGKGVYIGTKTIKFKITK